MTVDARVAALEGKVQELEAMLTLALRLLSVERPVSALLERYGAPSFGGFVNDMHQRFPAVRGDREFVSLLLDALKLDRPGYRQLHTYITDNNWPQWS